MQEMPRRRLVSRFGNILTAGALITVSGFGIEVGFKLTGASESAGNDNIARRLDDDLEGQAHANSQIATW